MQHAFDDNSAHYLNVKEFERIYLKYVAALIFFANRIMRNKEHAEDIVSEIFIKLWDKRTGFQSEATVKAFLYISVRNACFNALKSESRRDKEQSDYHSHVGITEDFILNEITRAEVLRAILQLVKILPPECQKVMLMRLAGMENKDIAAKLNISIHTVKNQAARGIYLMRKRYRNDQVFITLFILKLISLNN